MNKYYIYAHSTEAYGIFYIGKGSNKRLFTTGNRSDFWKRIVKKHGYTASILEECKTEEIAYEREIFWISKYKKENQCIANFSLGGDGVKVEKRWWGDAISAAMAGRPAKKGIESHNYKGSTTREELEELYLNQQLNTIQIAEILKLTHTTISNRLKEFGIQIRGPESNRKIIVCTSDGREFESITNAANETGLYRENIRKVLSGKYKTTGGLHFKYKE